LEKCLPLSLPTPMLHVFGNVVMFEDATLERLDGFLISAK
jgi:hypothetical protein